MNSNANTVPAVLSFSSIAAGEPKSTVRVVKPAARGVQNVWTIVERAYVEASAVQAGVLPEELHMVSLVRRDRVPRF